MLVPFNFLQSYTLGVGPFRVPFYHPLLAGVAVFAAVCAWALSPRLERSDLLLLGLLIPVVLSAAANAAVFGVARGVATFALLGPLTAFSARRLFRTEPERKAAIRLLLGGGFTVALLAVGEALLKRNILYHALFQTANPYYRQLLPLRGGVASTIGHALPLGVLLVTLLPLVFQTENSRMGLMLGTTIIAGILMTLTRSAWMVAAGVLVTGSFRFPRFRWPVLCGAALGAALFIGAVGVKARIIRSQDGSAPQSAWRALGHRLDPRSLPGEIFSSPRTFNFRIAWKLIRQHPFFGVGYGNYPQAYYATLAALSDTDIPFRDREFRRFVMESRAQKSPLVIYQHGPDDQYVLWLSETGLVGGSVLVVFTAWLLIAGWRQTSPDARVLTICAGAFLANLNTLDGFIWLAPLMTFWLIVGLLLSAVAGRERVLNKG